MAPALAREEVLPFPKSHAYITLDEYPELVLVNETVRGPQPPILSTVKSAFNCACAWLHNSSMPSIRHTVLATLLNRAERVVMVLGQRLKVTGPQDKVSWWNLQ